MNEGLNNRHGDSWAMQELGFRGGGDRKFPFGYSGGVFRCESYGFSAECYRGLELFGGCSEGVVVSALSRMPIKSFVQASDGVVMT